MAHRLDGFKDQIVSLKSQGLSVRKIAEAISQPSSTVQHYISTVLKRDSNADGGKEIAQGDGPTTEAAVMENTAREKRLQREKSRERRERPRRSRYAPLKGLAIGVSAVVAVWLCLSVWNWYSNRPSGSSSWSIGGRANVKGIQLEVFRTGEHWYAVRWPSDGPSPLTRIERGYKLQLNGEVKDILVDESMLHGEIGKPVIGMAITEVSEATNQKLMPLCKKEIETLHCGGLWTFIKDTTTWGDWAMTERSALDR